MKHTKPTSRVHTSVLYPSVRGSASMEILTQWAHWKLPALWSITTCSIAIIIQPWWMCSPLCCANQSCTLVQYLSAALIYTEEKKCAVGLQPWTSQLLGCSAAHSVAQRVPVRPANDLTYTSIVYTYSTMKMFCSLVFSSNYSSSPFICHIQYIWNTWVGNSVCRRQGVAY